MATHPESKAAPDGAVTVDLWSEQAGDVKSAVWCNSCALPSALSIEMVVGTGCTVLARTVASKCFDCGNQWQIQV